MPSPLQILPPQKSTRIDAMKFAIPEAVPVEDARSFSKVLRKKSEPDAAEKTEKPSPKKPAVRTEKRKADKPAATQQGKRSNDVDETDPGTSDEVATDTNVTEGAEPAAEASTDSADSAKDVKIDGKDAHDDADPSATSALAVAAAQPANAQQTDAADPSGADADAATEDPQIVARNTTGSSRAISQAAQTASNPAEKAGKPKAASGLTLGAKNAEQLAINPVDRDAAAGDQASTQSDGQPHKQSQLDPSQMELIKSMMPQVYADDTGVAPAAPKTAAGDHLTAPAVDAMLSKSPAPPTHAAAPAPATPFASELQFAEVNHPRLVSDIRGQLLAHGGTMQIRLDPPELGALQVSVEMRDGVMTASFQTSNDDATKLLSHSLGQLKAALESQGVSVEKLHVQQAPRDHESADRDSQQQRQAEADGQSARQEQQRREMLRRMWRRIANGKDPLDLVA